MISRKSSGSMRAESAVEPTRSLNMTVTWRRSANSWAFRSIPAAGSRVAGGSAGKFANGGKYFSPMPERNTNVLEVLITQMAEYGDIDLILSKALSVLSETELLKP